MASFQPQAFGKYFLVDKIATGGMAEIFKAKTYSHGGFENLLVIKRILPHIGENEDFIEMFIDEAKVSVALQHPNIVRIYDFGKILDNYFIAMECVDGKDTRNVLRKLARRRQYLPPNYCAYVALETCKGLSYAHQKADLQDNPYGIVHRDISPSNVIISYEAEVKVADFGIAKAESNAYQTRDGVLKGKFEYMSPEQATGKEIDARSDLFAVGIILYETLTGRRLFKTDSEIATLKKIRDCDFDPPSRLNPAVPEELERITMKALTRYPEDRYQNAREMVDELQSYIGVPPDQIKSEMCTFMTEIFAEEIADERSRLETNSEVAAKLRDEAGPEGWDGAASTMGQSGPQGTSTKTVVSWAVGAMVFMLGVAGASVGGVWYMITNIEQPEMAIELATTGDLSIRVLPDATIIVDDERRTTSGKLDLKELKPGNHTIRFEAEGYESYETRAWIIAGETTDTTWTMKETTTSSPAAAPGPKPTVGTGPRPTTAPKPTGTAPGKLKVTIAGGGWGTIYIDGQKIKQRAPLANYPISVGSHTIKVENVALGLSHTESINVGSGASISVTAQP